MSSEFMLSLGCLFLHFFVLIIITQPTTHLHSPYGVAYNYSAVFSFAPAPIKIGSGEISISKLCTAVSV